MYGCRRQASNGFQTNSTNVTKTTNSMNAINATNCIDALNVPEFLVRLLLQMIKH
jgi:hypothetical protein